MLLFRLLAAALQPALSICMYLSAALEGDMYMCISAESTPPISKLLELWTEWDGLEEFGVDFLLRISGTIDTLLYFDSFPFSCPRKN